MIRVLIAIALLFVARTAATQTLNITFDFSNARQTLRCVRPAQPEPGQIDRLLELSSTRGLMEKMKVDTGVMRKALMTAADTNRQTGAVGNMQYQYVRVKQQELTRFLALLEKKQDSLRRLLLQSLSAYFPGDHKANIRVCVLLGGYSSGFTLGDDSTFYLGLHQYKNDLSSVIETCRHELFHNVQRLWRNAYIVTEGLANKGDTGLAFVHYMLINLFQEGSAEYIADLRKVKSPGASVKDLLAHARVNESRESQVFYLISKLLVEVAEHPGDASQEELYNLLFDWNWNNPAYYAGYVMTRRLCREYGEQVLLKYLREDPAVFVMDYIRLASSATEPASPRFTPRFEELMKRLDNTIRALPAP